MCVNNYERWIPFVSLFFAPYHTLNQNNIDAITSDSLPQHLGTPETLMQLPILSDMRLVGGTSLALQYGHRRSVDLDFFGTTTSDVDELTETLRENVGELTMLSASKTIRVYNISNVKVDIVNYIYPWIDEPIKENGLILDVMTLT